MPQSQATTTLTPIELMDETGFRFHQVVRPICQSLCDLGLSLPPGDWGARGGFLNEYGVAFCEFLNRGDDRGG